ncbi:MAG TPA: hypothetical protein DCQ51_01525 [Planktothrix sp. UBA8407]|jgi:hypothetical protein|nr:hypothetical protein [Planktothrix sp. UBA8402]HAO09881.1 hypothetical protein [Planktothrix sp. UBA8407]HBK25080.1 hypothetical protein [Planktothrix sp. UBA10369]
MKLKLKSKVDAEGKLFLQLPQEFANQELEIIIDSAQEKMPTPEELGYPADFFERTAGKWEGELWVRKHLVNCDKRIWDIE